MSKNVKYKRKILNLGEKITNCSWTFMNSSWMFLNKKTMSVHSIKVFIKVFLNNKWDFQENSRVHELILFMNSPFVHNGHVNELSLPFIKCVHELFMNVLEQQMRHQAWHVLPVHSWYALAFSCVHYGQHRVFGTFHAFLKQKYSLGIMVIWLCLTTRVIEICMTEI